jgi:hypothetical protein
VAVSNLIDTISCVDNVTSLVGKNIAILNLELVCDSLAVGEGETGRRSDRKDKFENDGDIAPMLNASADGGREFNAERV